MNGPKVNGRSTDGDGDAFSPAPLDSFDDNGACRAERLSVTVHRARVRIAPLFETVNDDFGPAKSTAHGRFVTLFERNIRSLVRFSNTATGGGACRFDRRTPQGPNVKLFVDFHFSHSESGLSGAVPPSPW